jgi:hypothetical protein
MIEDIKKTLWASADIVRTGYRRPIKATKQLIQSLSRIQYSQLEQAIKGLGRAPFMMGFEIN